MMRDDSSLIERCVKRDPLAWARFVDKYSTLISISIENRLRKYFLDYSRTDLDDIRQNVLASIWKGNKLFYVKNRKDISCWIAVVSGNIALDYMRQRAAKDRPAAISIYEEAGENILKEMIEAIPHKGPAPDDEAVRNELSSVVNEEIARLQKRERLIVKLNLLHQKTHEEIAKITRFPVGTVSSSIKRSKDRLRERLKKYLQEF